MSRRPANRVPATVFIWTLLWGSNLVLPLLLVSSHLAGTDWVGLIFATAIFWGIGLWLCFRSDRWRKCVYVGTGLLALSQLIPIAQLVSGAIALSVWRGVGGENPAFAPIATDDDFQICQPMGMPGAFFVTALTGLMLFSLALTVGSLFYWPFRREPTPEFEPID